MIFLFYFLNIAFAETAPQYSCVEGYSPNWITEYSNTRGSGAEQVLFAGTDGYTETECKEACESYGAAAYNWQDSSHSSGSVGCRCYSEEALTFTPTGVNWQFCTKSYIPTYDDNYWQTCTYGEWVDVLDDYQVNVNVGFGERIRTAEMVNNNYFVEDTIDHCKSRCDSYVDENGFPCNGINYVTTNQRCFLYSKAREIEPTDLSNRQSTYKTCTQCANWCKYNGINGWCQACSNFDKCKECTECQAEDKCTIRSTECKRWCHRHTRENRRCSFTQCEGCNFCPQICPKWCNRDEPNCQFVECQNCEQCRED